MSNDLFTEIRHFIPGFLSFSITLREHKGHECRAIVDGKEYSFNIPHDEMISTDNIRAWAGFYAQRISEAMKKVNAT